LGEITTTRENSVDLTVQELKFTIRYCTGVDENNIPKYQMYGTGNESLAIYLK
jgi:hypothetical protein